MLIQDVLLPYVHYCSCDVSAVDVLVTERHQFVFCRCFFVIAVCMYICAESVDGCWAVDSALQETAI